MTRDELIDAGLQAVLVEADHLGQELTFRDELVVIIDAVEQIIRADEREKVNVSWQVDFDNEMADLRAKVSALPRSGIEIPYAKGVEHEYEMVRRADVLRLIDGGSDD